MSSGEANQPVFVSLGELAARVQSRQKIGVGGHHFARLPLALLREVIRQRPQELEYISWGGGLSLELLLAAKMVRKIAFCFSSLDIFGLAPLFRQALEDKTVEVEEWPALAMIQAFEAAQERLPSLPFQIPLGSEVMERSSFAPVYNDPISETEVGAARALALDVFLMHATRADEDGNVEIQGALGLDMRLLGAARQVLVTVEEIVPRGTFQQSTRGKIISRVQISAIAVVPAGAYPSSCLPYYTTDYAALLEATASVPVEVPEPTHERLTFVEKAASISFGAIKVGNLPFVKPTDEDNPPTIDEQMVVTLARSYNNQSYCQAGAVSPLAVVSYLLAKRLHAPRMVICTMSGGLLDIGLRPAFLTLAESLDTQSAVLHCGGEDTYHWHYQPGLVSHEVVSAAQIDRFGRTNNIEISPPGRKPIRLPGQGGMADVANFHQNFLLYLTRHSPRTMVESVDYASAARALLTDEERKAVGLRPGYVRLVTNLGVFEVNHASREFELVSIHSGVELEQLVAETGFPLKVSTGLTVTPAPTPEELLVLRGEIDPLGIRRLEFISGPPRVALIKEILGQEAALINKLSPTFR